MVQTAFYANKKLTLNDLYAILLSFLYAKKNKKAFFIKINDLDNPNYELTQDNLAILNKFGIDTKNHLYQTQFKNIYQSFLKELLAKKKAYLCNCNETLCKCQTKNLQKKDFNNENEIKIKLSAPAKTTINNQTLSLENITLFEQNNFTPLFANALDELISKASFFLKENNEILQSALTLYLQTIFHMDKKIEYLFFEGYNEKVLIEQLLKEGFLPDAIINYLFSDNKKEFFYLKDLTFDKIKVPLKKNTFNKQLLKEFNKLHLKNIDSKRLSQIVGFADSDIGELLKLYLDKNISINELQEIFKKYFSPKKCTNSLKELALIIQKAPYYKTYSQFINYLKNALPNFNEDDLYYLITGMHKGPKLEKIYPFIKSYLLEVAKCQS